jgi:hypothetical protein
MSENSPAAPRNAGVRCLRLAQPGESEGRTREDLAITLPNQHPDGSAGGAPASGKRDRFRPEPPYTAGTQDALFAGHNSIGFTTGPRRYVSQGLPRRQETRPPILVRNLTAENTELLKMYSRTDALAVL